MKIKTIDQYYNESYGDFDSRVNDFIKDKQVVQITTNETVSDDFELTHTLTILYKEG